MTKTTSRTLHYIRWAALLLLLGLLATPRASVRASETVRLEAIGTIDGVGLHVFATAFSPDGKHLVVASGQEPIQVYEVGTLKRTLRLGHLKQSSEATFREIAFAPDGKRLAIGETHRRNEGFDGRVHLADLATGTLVKTVDFDWPVQGLAYTPNGKWLAVALMSGNVHLLDPSTGRLYTRLGDSRERRDIAGITFQRDGKRLAVAFYAAPQIIGDKTVVFPDAEIHIWDVATSKLDRRLLKPEAGGPGSIAFSSRSDVLAAAYSRGSVHLWDVGSGKLKASYEHDDGPVRAVAYTSDGRYFASGGYDGELRLWDIATNKLLLKVNKSSQLSQITTIAFSPDDKILAVGGSGKSVILWKPIFSKTSK